MWSGESRLLLWAQWDFLSHTMAGLKASTTASIRRAEIQWRHMGTRGQQSVSMLSVVTGKAEFKNAAVWINFLGKCSRLHFSTIISSVSENSWITLQKQCNIYMLYKPQSTVIRAHTNISEGTSNLCIKSTKSEIDKKKKRKRNKTLCSDLVI